MNDQTRMILAKVRKGRWMTLFLNHDGSVRETKWWPTKKAATAWIAREEAMQAINIQISIATIN